MTIPQIRPSDLKAKSAQSWKNYYRDRYMRQIAGGAVLVLIGVLLGYFLFGPDSTSDYDLSLFTGLLGILVTVLVLDRLSERRAVALEKQTLIAQLGSPSNIITRQAIKVLWARGWLQDGSLQHASLWEADLQEADLGECDLRYVKLKRANLRKARLWARLEGALLTDADLTDVWLYDHYEPNRRASFDADTILPDGTHYDPARGFEQFDRFINPGHQDYFYSEDTRSPAYRGIG